MTPNPPIRLSRTRTDDDALPSVEMPRVETKPYLFPVAQPADVPQFRALEARCAALESELELARTELAAERIDRQATDRLYMAELANGLRMEQLYAEVSRQLAEVLTLHSQLSLDNLHLRHQVAGTTPVAVKIAIVADEEKTVMDDPDAKRGVK